jgi:ligand-binding sensor domain-containing protein
LIYTLQRISVLEPNKVCHWKSLLTIGGFLICYFTSGVILTQPSNLAFQHLTKENGLLEGWNWYVKKDTRGFVWISSIYGLNRFDGVNVKKYTEDKNNPCSLYGQNVQSKFYEDIEGNLWFCTYQALHQYNRKADCFQRYQYSSGGKKIESDYQIIDLDEDGNLWILFTGSFVVTFNLKSKSFSEPKFQTIATRCYGLLDNAGKMKMIIGSRPTNPALSIFEISNNKVKSKRDLTPANLTKSTSSVYYNNLHIENDSLLWIANVNGLILYNLHNQASKLFNRYDKHIIDEITSMTRYEGDRLLLTTTNGKLCIFDKNLKGFTNFYTNQPDYPSSLSKSELANVYVDADNTIWVSMYKRGIDWAIPNKMKFDIRSPFNYLLSNGENLTIQNFLEDKAGNVWCGTDKGLFILDPTLNAIKHKKTTQDAIFAFEDNRNRFWFGNRFVYKVFDPDNRELIANVTSPNEEIRFLESSSLINKGTLISSFSGVYRAELNGTKVSLNKIKELKDQPYISPYQDQQGRVFISRNNEGILVGHFTENMQFDSLDWLPILGEVYAWLEDSIGHMLWIGTESGLVKIDARTLQILKTYGLNDGLPQLNVFSILESDANHLWLSTNNGLSRFNKEKEVFRNYNVTDGLPSMNFSPRAAVKLRSGEFLYGCGSKIISFFPGKVKDNDIPPRIQITKLLINDLPPSDTIRCQITGAKNIEEIKKLVLAPNQNTVSLEFVAIEYGDPKMNKIRYKLKNYDQQWLYTENPGLARFPKLPHGNYTLLIEAFNADGIGNPMLKELEIVVLPKWYQTLLFYFSSLVLAILFFFGLYKLRINQIERLQKMRHQIASDLHDEVGSTLTGIRMFSDTVKMSIRDDHLETLPLLDRIGDNAQKCLNSIRDIIWAINPESDKLGDLIRRMKESAFTICEAKGVNCVFDVTNFYEHLKASPAIKHNLLLVFKEAVNNALKYSEADKLEIAIKVTGNKLEMIIKDNGKGFDRNLITPGNGLYNMERRAEALGSCLVIESSPGQGTSVSLSINLS